jgi:4-amino-4-deoxy-L-arabinose transferase-like glycosyltransferase
MTDRARWSSGQIAGCLVVLVLALAVRAGYLVTCADSGRHDGPIRVQDTAESTPAVAAIENGQLHWSGQQSLYDWSISILARIWSEPGRRDQIVRWIQCVFGALAAVFYFLAARLAFRSAAVALLAGLFGALSPFWVAATADMNDAVACAFLLSVCLWAGTRGGQAVRGGTSWLFGVTLAALAYMRVGFLPFGWIALAWYLFRSRLLPGGWISAVLAIVGVLTVALPWGYRNYLQSQDVYPQLRTLYVELWEGNNPEATGGSWRQPAPSDKSDRQLLQEVGQEVAHNPAGTLQRRLWAGLSFFFGEDFLRQQRLWRENAAGENGPTAPGWFRSSYAAALYGWLLVMLLLAVLGWRWSYDWRTAARPLALALLWIPLPYLLGQAAPLAGPRLPLDGVLMTYTAFALAGRKSATEVAETPQTVRRVPIYR